MEALDKLVGKKITKIRMDEEFLVFETDGDEVHAFTVEGDCCSHSYFFDFYGVRQLLEGGKVTSTEEVDLSPGDPGYRAETFEVENGEWEDTQVYGFRISVEHRLFGEVSGVMSFRNDSNGYYGGWMYATELNHRRPEDIEELTEDKIG
jgi:hypothetical protein